ncbi:DUF4347 domain-containing protein, partial [Microcoleus sp. herbarium12]|uniref:DUF4347 domain-containing protein n=1 Tax=Microcoleus sp. herbarium12 TaxID=3055437 RepID=UPI002FD6F9F3
MAIGSIRQTHQSRQSRQSRSSRQIRQGLKPTASSESRRSPTEEAIGSEVLQSVSTDLCCETGVLTPGGLRDKHKEPDRNQFLSQLHQLTGAKIAANSQPTGNSKLGGTWDIPQLIPPSNQRAKLALTETTLKTYSGVLSFSPQVEFPTNTGPESVSIGDINGDGKPDLATANWGSNTASILLNTTATNATTP